MAPYSPGILTSSHGDFTEEKIKLVRWKFAITPFAAFLFLFIVINIVIGSEEMPKVDQLETKKLNCSGNSV